MAQKQTSTHHLPEITPPWLLDLLQKHGEGEGTLDGVPEGHPSYTPDPEAQSDDIADLPDSATLMTESAASGAWDFMNQAALSPDDSSLAEEAFEQDPASFSPVASSASPEPLQAEEDDLDWLKELAQSDSSPSPDPQLTSPDQADTAEADPEDFDFSWFEAAQSDLPETAEMASALDQSPASPSPEDASAEDDLAWLDTLDTETASAPAEPSQLQAMPSELAPVDDIDTGWLNDIMSGTDHETETLEPSTETPEDGLDWLAELEASPTDEAISPPAASMPPATGSSEEGEGLPDWMSDLITQTGTLRLDDVSTDPESLSQDASQESLDQPDWPANSERLASTDATTDSTFETGDRDLPDWMQALEAGSDEASDTVDGSSSKNSFDWLNELRAETESIQAEENPDWLAELETDSGQKNTPADTIASEATELVDTSDWVTVFSDSVENDAPTESEADLADWTEVLEPDLPGPDVETPVDLFDTDSGEMPSWFAELQAEAADAAGIDLEMTPSDELNPSVDDVLADGSEISVLDQTETEDDLPDWMQVFGTDLAAVEIPVETSDWLADLESDEGQGELTEAAATASSLEIPSEGDDALDWLQGLEESPQPEVALSEDTDIGDSLSWLDQLSDETDEAPPLDDWLTELDQPSASGDVLVSDLSDSPIADSLVGLGDENIGGDMIGITNWLDELDLTADQTTSEADTPLDWLDTLDSTEATEAEEPSIPISYDQETVRTRLENEIPLPFQTEDMRSAPSDEMDRDVVTARLATAVVGVGSGLAIPRGVQTETDAALGRSTEQAATEGQPRSMSRLVRVSLNLIFVLLLALPLFIHRTYEGYLLPWFLPSLDQQQAINAEVQEVILTKPPHSVALVSFDYTPATAGEMTPLALALVKQLLGQGLRVIAISLEPTGQAEAQHILQSLDSDRYQAGEDFINLGYLLGGPLAIRRLNSDKPFDQLIEVNSGQAYAAYENWPDFHSIGEIGLVVEIGATPETVRWWAEQLQADSSQTMMAAVSAAAEPFARPYRDSQQYEVLIVGINGAAALETTQIEPGTIGPALAMLDSQSIAHLIIMMLMLFGTVAGLIEKYGQDLVVEESTTKED